MEVINYKLDIYQTTMDLLFLFNLFYDIKITNLSIIVYELIYMVLLINLHLIHLLNMAYLIRTNLVNDEFYFFFLINVDL